MQIRDVFNRLTEPSSHGGLAALSQVVKIFAPQWGPVFDALTMLFGALAVALPEKKSDAPSS